MNLFDVYDLMDIEPVKAKGSYLWDVKGDEYLDFYGGHAVISIGHTHPVYVEKITGQLNKIGFYSNSVINPLQVELAEKVGKISGYEDYSLFLCNSGAEANENALKLASFHTGRKKVLTFKGAFHGRTSAAVAVTDNPSIQAPVNKNQEVVFIEWNDTEALRKELTENTFAAVIIEGIQGVGGIKVAEDHFLQEIRKECTETGTVMILDEIQCGYGRTGKFFSHQHAGVKPDIITTAKGMGNGFPIGGLLISSVFEAKKGMLGTTFGGSHLACAAALAVVEVMENEKLVENAAMLGEYLTDGLQKIEGVKNLRGRGLMIGLDTDTPQAEVRKELLEKHRILVGYSGKHTLRLLPALNITRKEADKFLEALKSVLN